MGGGVKYSRRRPSRSSVEVEPQKDSEKKRCYGKHGWKGCRKRKRSRRIKWGVDIRRGAWRREEVVVKFSDRLGLGDLGAA